MLACLLASAAWCSVRILVDLPVRIGKAVLGVGTKGSPGCSFYEGDVHHVRTRPLENSFRCAQSTRVTSRRCAAR